MAHGEPDEHPGLWHSVETVNRINPAFEPNDGATARLRAAMNGSTLVTLALVAILAVGAAARLYVLWRFEAAPGDGLLRTLIAHWWVQGLGDLDATLVEHDRFGWWSMRLPVSGPWPPGHFVLLGLFGLPGGDPLFAARLGTVLLGTASIYLMWRVAAGVFGTAVGLLSAASLALLPLHVTLSTNPLAEVPALFFLLAILAVAIGGLDHGFTMARLALLACLALVGTMIRYEVWLVLPAVPVACLYQSRSMTRTALATAAVSVAPLAWMLSSWLLSGSPFATFSGPLDYSDPMGPWPALLLTIEKLSLVAGYFIIVAAVLGVVLLLADLSDEAWTMRAIYAGVALLQLAFLSWFAGERGATLFDRMILMTAALMIPLAAHALSNRRALVAHGLVGAAMIGSTVLSVHLERGPMYVRRSQPQAVVEAAAWLDRRMGRDDAFVATRLGGDVHLIALLTGKAPHNVLYPHQTPERMQAVWATFDPAFLLMLAGDELAERLLKQFEARIDHRQPPGRFGPILIYAIKRPD